MWSLQHPHFHDNKVIRYYESVEINLQWLCRSTALLFCRRYIFITVYKNTVIQTNIWYIQQYTKSHITIDILITDPRQTPLLQYLSKKMFKLYQKFSRGQHTSIQISIQKFTWYKWTHTQILIQHRNKPHTLVLSLSFSCPSWKVQLSPIRWCGINEVEQGCCY